MQNFKKKMYMGSFPAPNKLDFPKCSLQVEVNIKQNEKQPEQGIKSFWNYTVFHDG